MMMARWKLLTQLVCSIVIFNGVTGYVYMEKKAGKPADQKPDGTQIASGYSYRIRNRRSSLYMTDVNGQSPIKQFPLKVDQDRDSQIWFLTQTERDGYFISNKKSGLFILDRLGATKKYGPAGYGAPTFLRDAPETWIIKHVPSATEGHYLTIMNKVTHWYLLLGGYSTTSGGEIHHYPLGETIHLDSQQWAFEVVGEFPVLESVNRTVDDIGDIPKITSWQQATPSKTNEVLIGQVTIPFPLIVDPEFSELQRSKVPSSHYTLRRYGYWRRVSHHDHSGVSQVTVTDNITLGLVTNNARAIGKILGLCVTADSSLCVASSRMRSMVPIIANGLKINVDEDQTEVSSKTMQLDRKYVTLNRLRHGMWFREDRYVLERKDGGKILDWITRVPTTIDDGFRGREMMPQN